MARISVKKISKIYGGANEAKIIALKDISFSIEQGELVVILGASGAGKSTLLNILGGMDRATSGQYIVDDNDITKMSNKQLGLFRRNDIGFVFQFYNLIPNLTALENIKLAESVTLHSENSFSVLKAVGLEDRADNFPSELSGGEQQRVSIARAIVKAPGLLLCDEPTGALDSKTGVAIIRLLKNICREQKKTVIIVTHNSAISQIADRLIRMQDGGIVEDTVNNSPKAVDEIIW